MRLKFLFHKGERKGEVLFIDKFPAFFGRGEDCTCQLTEGGISRKHFAIEQVGENFVLKDLGSKNGTFVNGEPVLGQRNLGNGDVIAVANEMNLEVIFQPKTDPEIPLIRHPTKKIVPEPHAKPATIPETAVQKDDLPPSHAQRITDSGSFIRRRVAVTETTILGPTSEKLYYSHRALKTIYEVVEQCNSEANPERLFECLLQSLAKAISSDRGAVLLKKDDICHGRAFMAKRQKSDPFSISTTILKDVIENGVSVISLNPEEDARYRFSESLRLQKVMSLICAPLISYEKVFGAVYLDRGPAHPKPFSEEDMELLAAIGIQVGTTLEKSLLLEELKYTLEEKDRLLQALAESEERYALAASGANDGLWDWNLKADKVYFSPRWKSMLGCNDTEIGSAPSFWFDRVHSDDREQVKMEVDTHVKGLTSHFESEHRILHKDGSYRWVLTRGLAVRSKEGAVRMAGSQTDITERKRAEQQILHDAFHDLLTNLPNRTVFMDRLGHALVLCKRRKDYSFGLLYLGLDRFKVINDNLGHTAGDQLLTAIARRLEQCLRPGDTLARFAGDEFSLLLDDIEDIRAITRLADQIQQQFAAPFPLDGQDVFISSSMGIAMGTAEYETADSILRNASAAMYRAKELGRGRYEVYDKAEYADVLAQLQLELEMHRAVDRGEFEVHYQPIVQLQTGFIAGFEALVRWRHPQRGLISPMEFIPMAEETGMIVPLGAWVMKEACRKIRQWQDQFSSEPPIYISVNVSARQLMHQDLIGLVQGVLSETAISPENLKLEMTETTIMENSERVLHVLQQLRAMNIQLLIDDFGTGYSSLSYLHRFPFTTLKIDQSFIMCMGADRENAEIVRTILALARNLDMSIIAEGIENEESFRELKALNCQYGQGYFFSRPLAASGAGTLIADHRRWG